MSLTIVATPKAANANSYLTLEEAEAYFTARVHIANWTAASTDEKNAVLVWATRLLDLGMEWAGTKRTQTQSLRWPRSGTMDRDGYAYDYDTVPQLVKDATCELALSLLARDRIAEPELLGQGFSDAKIGPLEVSVANPANLIGMIPDSVIGLLANVGLPANQAGSGSSGQVVRTIRA